MQNQEVVGVRDTKLVDAIKKSLLPLSLNLLKGTVGKPAFLAVIQLKKMGIHVKNAE